MLFFRSIGLEKFRIFGIQIFRFYKYKTILPVMTPPEHVKVYELVNSTIWFDENGILCSVSKKGPQQTLEEAKEGMKDFLKITGGKKVCMLSDNTESAPVNKEMRDYAAQVIPEVAKAIAILSNSSVGRMAANLFFSLKKQSYPVKFFDNEKDAKQWLKQYL